MNKNIALAMFIALATPGVSLAQAKAITQKAHQNVSPAVMNQVKTMAEALIKKGVTAGDGYGEVWIRDLNTFIELSCKVNDKSQIRKHLITFFQFQQADGAILDGYIPSKQAGSEGTFYKSDLVPGYLGHKNTVETDQETSLIQAIAKYINITGDKSILNEQVAGLPVKKQMERAMDFLMKERFNEKYGLIWGATTADWGDVQPEQGWGVVIDENTHRAIDIYDNAMFLIAINDFIQVGDLSPAQITKWKGIYKSVRENINKYLWDDKAQKYIPHIYLNGSPFPASFDESKVYYHGGTAVAIEAGLLTKKQVKEAYEKMQQNVKDANAATIGLTLYPVYPAGSFQNKVMGPYSYQNGGDWTWFGGRMVTQLIRYNLLAEAKEALDPMLARVISNNGFYEWYTPDNKPKGSSSFRGEAGVLWTAITELEKKK
ncbi:hypothetical protein OC25_18495 [Pedobacter kyungheensis]|uniref:Glycosyl hydrolase 94 catalytic domain-containing protein n=1 Tax=Pedobacter kyungheensis TaxID=1069985 RepID=A0A0C1D4W2_9SPHI|nr:hypothetical protein [Pedobacter kyungheensis]KIA92076.1 hypothetical protein OC25_18495 [Pedobacter kyungheensis]